MNIINNLYASAAMMMPSLAAVTLAACLCNVGRLSLLHIQLQRPDGQTVGHASPVITASTAGLTSRYDSFTAQLSAQLVPRSSV